MSILRGVVKDELRKAEAGFADGVWEKRKGCEAGSRREGVDGFAGDSNTPYGPVVISLAPKCT